MFEIITERECYWLQLVERQQMKVEEQKEENVEITQELRLTRYNGSIVK